MNIVTTVDSDLDAASMNETIRTLEEKANYKPWLTQTGLYLSHKDLQKVVSGKEPQLEPPVNSAGRSQDLKEESKELIKWTNKAEKSSYIISLPLKDGQLEHIDSMSDDNPKIILWSALRNPRSRRKSDRLAKGKRSQNVIRR
ncbi:hypothetical protein GP486_003319 [Trichoglossum hirsutum]|uniref:Uncharacterized protein n=1 Tax=Trichoglossum hirsutum TaxID=265104 RepID=A0A9P8LDA4_9PEZI|nr:hypothetical protein GP486_003319 [Trichoglossum hirsutum]